MKVGARLLSLGAALVVLALPIGWRARAAPILLDAVRLATPVDEAAEFCLPGWRLDRDSRCVPKRRRWWFR